MRFLPVESVSVFSCCLLAAGLFAAVAATPMRAATAVAATSAAAKTKPDVLVFSNGDQLTGTLDHVADGNVFFKSDNAGTIQVPWAKLKALHAEGQFAVIETGVLVRRKRANLEIPIGTVELNGDTLTVTTTKGPQQIPIKQIAYIVDQPTFEKNVRSKQGLLQGITGTVSAGVSTVNSTQNSQGVNSAVVLSRAVPPVAWMPPRERTLLNFTSSYGQVTQPGTPNVKTNILHGSLEEDEYFSPRFYLLQQAVFDHNYSQGLDLQQLYGFGVGWTAIKNDKQELDLTALIDYTKQQFSSITLEPATNNNLIGSSFGDNYKRTLPKKIVFTEIAIYNPAWNVFADYSANVAAGVTFPVYKNFGFTAGIVDSYLNDPAPGFQANSFQFTTALTYAISH